jgi:hypothetical protein
MLRMGMIRKTLVVRSVSGGLKSLSILKAGLFLRGYLSIFARAM